MAEPSHTKRFVFWLLAVSLPFLVIAAVELLLRAVNVGAEQQRVFVTVPGQENYLAFNPEYPKRYFPGFSPAVSFDPFLKTKPEDTFRIFVLGGSSAAGFPYQAYDGFPRRMAARLESSSISRRIEVVNLGMTAVNSFTLWDLRRAIMKQSPDAVVIYAGHNEYYGAFGAGSNIYSLGNRIWLKRLTLRLKKSILYSQIEQLVTRSNQPDDEDRTMMAQVVRESEIGLDSKTFQAGVQQFESNITDVVEFFADRDVPVFIGTVVSNDEGQEPLGEDSEATRLFNEGQFQQAKDLDPIRFRAPSQINDVIRELNLRSGVEVVAIDSAFSEIQVQPDSLFTDHLHPTHEGYELMAERFAEAISRRSESFQGDFLVSSRPPDPISAAVADLQIGRLKSGYPFVKDGSPDSESARFAGFLERFLEEGTFADSAAVDVVLGRVFIDQALRKVSRDRRMQYDTLGRLQNYSALMNWLPFDESFVNSVLTLVANVDSYYDIAGEIAAQAMHDDWDDLAKVNLVAAIRLRQGELGYAGKLLDRVESMNPSDVTMLANQARLHVMAGDTLTARRYFERMNQAR